MIYFKKSWLKLLNFLTLVLFFPLVASANENYPAIFVLFYWGPILVYIFAVLGLWWIVSSVAKRNRRLASQSAYLWKVLFSCLVIIITIIAVLLGSIGSLGFTFGDDFTWMYLISIGFLFACYVISYKIKRPATKFFNNYFIASYTIISLLLSGFMLYALSVEAFAMSGKFCDILPAGIHVWNGESARSHCFSQEARASGNAKGCDMISNNNERDECYINVAFENRDTSLCGSITSSLRKQDCFVSVVTQLAKEKNDISICDQLVGETDYQKRMCQERVKESDQTP